MTDTCVSCGAVIPEGRMVCPNCENGANLGGKPAGGGQVMTLLDARDWSALETAMRRQEPLAIIHDFPGRGITVTASVEKAPEVWGCTMIVSILVDGPGKARRQRQHFRSVEEAKKYYEKV